MYQFRGSRNGRGGEDTSVLRPLWWMICLEAKSHFQCFWVENLITLSTKTPDIDMGMSAIKYVHSAVLCLIIMLASISNSVGSDRRRFHDTAESSFHQSDGDRVCMQTVGQDNSQLIVFCFRPHHYRKRVSPY